MSQQADIQLDDSHDQEDKASRADPKIEQLLLDKRRVFIFDPIDDKSARKCIHQSWYLADQDPDKPILLIINTPGGSVSAGFAIWDHLKLIPCPIITLITGMAASMGSILGLVADKGRRLSTPLARIMIHQPLISGVIQGQATDLEIQAKEIIKTRSLLIKLYAEAIDKPDREIEEILDRDKWMSASEAQQFGLVDEIVGSNAELAHHLSV